METPGPGRYRGQWASTHRPRVERDVGEGNAWWGSGQGGRSQDPQLRLSLPRQGTHL